MNETVMTAFIVMFFWLLILTVAFIFHWMKVERNLNVTQHSGSKVSESLKSKVLGKSKALDS